MTAPSIVFAAMKHATLALALVVLGSLALGCATPIHLRVLDIEPDKLPDYSVSGPVRLVSAQANEGPLVITGNEGGSFVFSPREWTDTAIEILGKELRAKGMPDGEGEKELRLSVTRASGVQAAFTTRCTVFLSVETGEGYSQKYEGQAGSGLGINRACETGLTRALGWLLNDEQIQQYLP